MDPNPSLLITGSPTVIHIIEKSAHICFHSKDHILSHKLKDSTNMDKAITRSMNIHSYLTTRQKVGINLESALCELLQNQFTCTCMLYMYVFIIFQRKLKDVEYLVNVGIPMGGREHPSYPSAANLFRCLTKGHNKTWS